jgi:chromosome segregation ATPase
MATQEEVDNLRAELEDAYDRIAEASAAGGEEPEGPAFAQLASSMLEGFVSLSDPPYCARSLRTRPHVQLEDAAAAGADADLLDRAERAEAKLQRVEDAHQRLQLEADRNRDDAEALQDRLAGVERDLREATRLRTEAEDALQRTRAQLDRREDELQRERQRATDAAAAGMRAAKDRQSNTAELDKLAAENGELREELRAVLDDLQVRDARA